MKIRHFSLLSLISLSVLALGACSKSDPSPNRPSTPLTKLEALTRTKWVRIAAVMADSFPTTLPGGVTITTTDYFSILSQADKDDSYAWDRAGIVSYSTGATANTSALPPQNQPNTNYQVGRWFWESADSSSIIERYTISGQIINVRQYNIKVNKDTLMMSTEFIFRNAQGAESGRSVLTSTYKPL